MKNFRAYLGLLMCIFSAIFMVNTDLANQSVQITAINVLYEKSRDFKIYNPAGELSFITQKTDSRGNQRFVYQQKYKGVEVYGGQLTVSLDNQGNAKSVQGNTVENFRISSVQPCISAQTAEQISLNNWPENPNNNLHVAVQSQLIIFDLSSILNFGNSDPRLVWKTVIQDQSHRTYIFFIDAQSSQIVYKIKQFDAVSRAVFDCSLGGILGDSNCYLNTTHNGYIYGRSEGQPARGTNPVHNDLEVDQVYDILNYAHSYYFTKFARNGSNNLGGTGSGDDYPTTQTPALVYIMDILPSTECPSSAAAFDPIDGVMLFMCRGFAVADVVVHEYQHGITENSVTGGLIYSGQSGALNEAYSDIFAVFEEYSRTGSYDWDIGESTPLGVIRNLEDPTTIDYIPGVAYPDRFYASGYYCGTQDNGGVHINSMVLGKASFLISEGGTFNGCSITGIGAVKAEQIFYHALTNHFTANTTFNNAYTYLIQSCTELIGTVGITSNDCYQVEKALQATEMNQAGACSGTPATTPLCALPPTFTPTPSPTPSIFINTTLDLEIITNEQRAIQIVFSRTGYSDIKNTVNSNTNGQISLGTSLTTTGSYDVYVKPQNFLSSKSTTSLIVGNTDLTFTNPFKTGDMNNDDIVNAVDFGLFAQQYGLSGIADFNLDGLVNGIDFAFFARNYTLRGTYLIDKSSWNW